MALNITEANDLNTILRFVLDEPGLSGEVPSNNTARLAASRLARSANKALAAGFTEQAILEGWAVEDEGPALTVVPS